MRRILVGLAIALVAVGATAGSAAAAATPVYDGSYAGTLPGNLPSVGAEAYSFKEFGDEVTFAGTARHLAAVRVTMSSWACQQGTWFNHDCVTTKGATFPVPITLNIYNKDTAGTPGSLITTVTKTFNIPYRPTANLNHCNGSNLGKWWQSSSSTCFNGKAANISFNFKSLGLTLPDTVVFGIAYNTSDYGYNPIGTTACNSTEAGCFYDSLNIGLGTDGVITGSKIYPDTVFQNAVYQADYCDGTPTPGVFNLDSPTSTCWIGYTPAIQVKAS